MIKENFLDKLIRWSIYILAFLMPLFFLTGSFEWFEFNKFYLLSFFSSLAILAFLIKKILFQKNFLITIGLQDFFVLIFLALATLGLFFSIDPISSFWGAYQRPGSGLLALASLVAIYFLIRNGKSFDLENKKITELFLLSGLICCLFFYFSIFNIFPKLSFIPAVFSRLIFGAGSDSMAVLSGYFLLLLLVLISTMLKNAKIQILGLIYFILLIFALFLINQRISFLIGAISTPLMIFFALKNKVFSKNINFLLLPIVIFVFCSLMFVPKSNEIILKLKTPGMPTIGQENNISFFESWKIGFKGATESMTSVLFGSGISTYSYDYAKYKESFIARDSYKTGNYLSEILATMGFLSLIIYLEIFALSFLSWIKDSRDQKEKEYFTNFIPILAIFLFQFFSYQNIVLLFYFWMFLGMAPPADDKNIFKKKFDFSSSPEAGLLANTFMIISAVIILCFWYLGIRYWIADYNFSKSQTIQDIDSKIFLIEKAVSLNPNVYHYYVTLASSYWTDFTIDLSGQKITEKSEIIKRLNKILEASQKAIKIAANRSLVWQSAGNLYSQISIALNSLGDNQEMSKKTIEAIKSAKELDPKNPYVYLTESQVYIGQKDYDKAIESIDQGLSENKDILLVLQKISILDLANKSKEALVYAIENRKQYPNNLDIIFQTARLAYKTGDKSLALQILKGITTILPNESNSLYLTGVIYEDSGDIANALKYFKKVFQLNPENQEIKRKINALETQQYQIKE